MANLKKKSRTELEKYVRELETELQQIPNALSNANPMHSEGAFLKESSTIDKPVLVVEDDEGLSTLIQKTLEKAGQQVTRVKTGAEAIEKVGGDPKFLLLLDYGLPDMTGAQLIQKLEENQQTIPFIMMTGSGNERTAVQMMKLGARDYLIKDSDLLEVLPEAIHRVMRELSTEAKLTQLQEALRETRQHLYSVINATPIILWSVDANGLITLSEGRALEQLDLQPGQIVGQSVFDVYATDPEALEAIQRGLEGEEFSIDVEVGGRIWNNHYIPIFDEQNNVVGLIGISIDTTERKQTIEALRQSEEKYRYLIENTNDLVYAADAEGTMTYIGPQAARYGFTPEEVISKNILKFIAPQDHDRIIEEFTLTMQTGMVFNSQFRLVDKGGNAFWVEDHANTIYDESGNITGISGTLRDITERKQVEEALLDSQEKLQTMFDTISDAINLTDMQGNIIDVNLASLATFGFSSKEEIIGHNASEFIAKEDQTKLLKHIEQTLKYGHGDTKEYRIVTHTGEQFDAEVNASVLRDGSGEPVAFMSVTRDVTERKQARQSLENKVEELERYKNVTIDRELKMIELKGIIKDLEDKLQKSGIGE